jgi:predicted amidohydrolase/ribosomal protein S18 acetylase RimI-like enzyme
MPDTDSKAKLIIRPATTADARKIAGLSTRIYGKADAMTPAEVRGQINNFPEGQFVAEYERKIVGHCATMIVPAEEAFAPHTWHQISGGGFGKPVVEDSEEGEVLYGLEVCVDPEYRRLRIGERFYRKRRELCQHFELMGIAFGGRMPGYQRKKRQFPNPQDYLDAVLEKQLRDTVIQFQVKQGFQPKAILPDYLPTDKESGGNAVLMYWPNPIAPRETTERRRAGIKTRLPSSVRVATVQFQMRGITKIDQFEEQVEYWVDVASDYNSDFVVFPELYTLELLSIDKRKLAPVEAIEKVSEYTQRYLAFMEKLAVSYNINIIGGSHPTRMESGEVRNIAYVFLRDGSTHKQEKLHPTPSERHWWNIKPGSGASMIPTDCGPIGVMICYDSEFPELARHLVNQGAMLLFVPFCTDERRGYLRVRYCCQARAVENQCYVVTSGVVGNLPHVEQMDVHYAESAILTPSDFPFARDGVAADTAPNTETIAIADLSLDDLLTSRQSGAVQNLKDRRFDLYRVAWKER